MFGLTAVYGYVFSNWIPTETKPTVTLILSLCCLFGFGIGCVAWKLKKQEIVPILLGALFPIVCELLFETMCWSLGWWYYHAGIVWPDVALWALIDGLQLGAFFLITGLCYMVNLRRENLAKRWVWIVALVLYQTITGSIAGILAQPTHILPQIGYWLACQAGSIATLLVTRFPLPYYSQYCQDSPALHRLSRFVIGCLVLAGAFILPYFVQHRISLPASWDSVIFITAGALVAFILLGIFFCFTRIEIKAIVLGMVVQLLGTIGVEMVGWSFHLWEFMVTETVWENVLVGAILTGAEYAAYFIFVGIAYILALRARPATGDFWLGVILLTSIVAGWSAEIGAGFSTYPVSLAVWIVLECVIAVTVLGYVRVKLYQQRVLTRLRASTIATPDEIPAEMLASAQISPPSAGSSSGRNSMTAATFSTLWTKNQNKPKGKSTPGKSTTGKSMKDHKSKDQSKEPLLMTPAFQWVILLLVSYFSILAICFLPLNGIFGDSVAIDGTAAAIYTTIVWFIVGFTLCLASQTLGVRRSQLAGQWIGGTIYLFLIIGLYSVVNVTSTPVSFLATVTYDPSGVLSLFWKSDESYTLIRRAIQLGNVINLRDLPQLCC